MPLQPVLTILLVFQAFLVSSTETRLTNPERNSSNQEIELERIPGVGKESPEEDDRETSQVRGASADGSARNVQENIRGEATKLTTATGKDNVYPSLIRQILGQRKIEDYGYDVQGRFSGRKRNAGNDVAVGSGFSGSKQKFRRQNSVDRKVSPQMSKIYAVNFGQRKSGGRKRSNGIKDEHLAVEWLKDEAQLAYSDLKEFAAGEEKRGQWRFGGRRRDNQGVRRNQWRFGGRKRNIEDDVDQWRFSGRKRDTEIKHFPQ